MTRSAGNPLFAEHLVLQGPGGPLPATLSELLVPGWSPFQRAPGGC